MKLRKLVSTNGMEYKTWLQYRKKGIGGSDAGSICGLNPYSTAISVFQDKTQQALEKPDNEAMRQGETWRNTLPCGLWGKPVRKSAGRMPSFIMGIIRSCLQM